MIEFIVRQCSLLPELQVCMFSMKTNQSKLQIRNICEKRMSQPFHWCSTPWYHFIKLVCAIFASKKVNTVLFSERQKVARPRARQQRRLENDVRQCAAPLEHNCGKHGNGELVSLCCYSVLTAHDKSGKKVPKLQKIKLVCVARRSNFPWNGVFKNSSFSNSNGVSAKVQPCFVPGFVAVSVGMPRPWAVHWSRGVSVQRSGAHCSKETRGGKWRLQDWLWERRCKISRFQSINGWVHFDWKTHSFNQQRKEMKLLDRNDFFAQYHCHKLLSRCFVSFQFGSAVHNRKCLFFSQHSKTDSIDCQAYCKSFDEFFDLYHFQTAPLQHSWRDAARPHADKRPCLSIFFTLHLEISIGVWRKAHVFQKSSRVPLLRHDKIS